MFNINDKVKFGEEVWRVVRYHKVVNSLNNFAHEWEIMFRNLKTGNHKSIPISQLESYIKAGK